MRRVAITGISGYIGSQLLGRLAAHPDAEAIVGIDTRPPASLPPKLGFHRRDVTQPLGELFSRERVDSAVHLAFVVRPARNERNTARINIEGTRNFLEACRAASVRRVVYLGSTAAYGAHPDNPVPLAEESPLRPNPRFQYSRDKAATDRLFQDFARANPQTAVTVLRGCVVMGPGGVRAIGARVFQPVMVRVAGHDPPVQYVHEADLVRLLMLVLERPTPGVFNVAGDGVLRYSEVARLARRPLVALPRPVLRGLMDATWTLRLQSQSNGAGLDFIAYPWVASNDRLQRATGFAYRYSSEETVKAYLRTKGGSAL